MAKHGRKLGGNPIRQSGVSLRKHIVARTARCVKNAEICSEVIGFGLAKLAKTSYGWNQRALCALFFVIPAAVQQ